MLAFFVGKQLELPLAMTPEFMKKAVIASDSFKGSLTSAQVAEAAAAGVQDIYPECTVIRLGIGDGGEGTARAMAEALSGEWISITVNDPLGRSICAGYALCEDSEGPMAVIELAEASGLTLIKESERNPLKTSTYGTGQMIRDAAGRGCRRFIIGIGGSATNDGGTGMLEALGFRFLDRDGKVIKGCCGGTLFRIASVDSSEVPEEILHSSFKIACDVDTPFYGKDGAAETFAPQKGASEADVELLEKGMRHFADVIRKYSGADLAQIKGSGAAGGTGGAFYAFLNGTLTGGADLVLDAIGFDDIIADADLIITGEGRIDRQTFLGKLPSAILRRASSKGIPVIAIGGTVDLGSDDIASSGFSRIIPAGPHPMTPEELAAAMDSANAMRNIRRTVAENI